MSKPDLAYQLRRHERARKLRRMTAGLYICANLLGIPIIYEGVNAVTRQGCARDLLCNISRETRREIIAHEYEDGRFADVATAMGAALVAGNIVYFMNGNKTNR